MTNAAIGKQSLFPNGNLQQSIGVDLGSYKAVCGVVKKGGIDIVLNDASGRQTP